MTYYLGVDGGGTKTELAAISEDGALLRRATGGSTNPHAATEAGAIRELLALLGALLDADDLRERALAGLCLGLSGVDLPAERGAFEEAIRRFLS
ncbi:MAG TPA: BadF/BadG/BcrA/BcrD ATPase family protein, partial [Paenibacillus sp.]|nr:BadF/BadG/BcrA/BcrD ATPase family protein [Paenibacillus sp.]